VDLLDWLQIVMCLEGQCFEKEGKEQDEYVTKFCCSLVCHIILRISI
jgi:hypothetical protein